MLKAGWSIRSTLRNNVHVVSSLLVHAVMCVFLVVRTPAVRPSGTGFRCPNSCSSVGIATVDAAPQAAKHVEQVRASVVRTDAAGSPDFRHASVLMPPSLSSYNPARMSLARSHSNSLADQDNEQTDVSTSGESAEGRKHRVRAPRRKLKYPANKSQGERNKGVPGEAISAVVGHFSRCWTLPAVMYNLDDSVVKINLVLSKDGQVTKADVTDERSYQQNPFFRAVADSALRAVYKCSPVTELMGTDYSLWSEVVLTFDPGNVS